MTSTRCLYFVRKTQRTVINKTYGIKTLHRACLWTVTPHTGHTRAQSKALGLRTHPFGQCPSLSGRGDLVSSSMRSAMTVRSRLRLGPTSPPSVLVVITEPTAGDPSPAPQGRLHGGPPWGSAR